jgi:cytochrome P450
MLGSRIIALIAARRASIMVTDIPSYDGDLFSDEGILNPYPHYRALRELGPVVYLTKQCVYALSRDAEVREALMNRDVFISGKGVGFEAAANDRIAGNTLCSDPPLHTKLRKQLNSCLMPGALSQFREQFQSQADALVAGLVKAGRFNAVRDLAVYLPTTIVTSLVGLPEFGRERMLQWAAGAFNVLGPANGLFQGAIPLMLEAVGYAADPATHAGLREGSWGHSLAGACAAGEISGKDLSMLLLDFIGPSLDTTINATTNAVWLFGQHPSEWDRLREDPKLLQNAINEVLRLESPIRGFTRYVAAEHTFSGSTIPAGSRVLILYASANRDERKWKDPERFDIGRRVPDQLAFGTGSHVCAGQHLAKLELTALLESLIRQVRRFSVSNPVWFRNNLLRGLESLDVVVEN